MNEYLIGFIAVMTAATFLTRVLPFLVFRGGAEHPTMLYIGRTLPPAIMLLLVIYCLKDVEFLQAPYGAPELVSLALVVVLHLCWRNALLSIGVGTGLYMYWIQNGLPLAG